MVQQKCLVNPTWHEQPMALLVLRTTHMDQWLKYWRIFSCTWNVTSLFTWII